MRRDGLGFWYGPIKGGGLFYAKPLRRYLKARCGFCSATQERVVYEAARPIYRAIKKRNKKGRK